MFWTEEILEAATHSYGTSYSFIVNDSKTPSGEAHVGSLRGALIHDAIFKVFKEKGLNVSFTFGSDDYDPVDEIPKGQNEHFEQYLGQPLCNVPAPPGSPHADMATHFITSFFDVFKAIGVEAELYRMRDIYRSGKFDEAIADILNHADKVREIYKKISGSVKSDSWYPFQPICEKCGRIGTTETTHFDGKEVTYKCQPKMVSWAKGCGYEGKVSPFGGKGKLPWKLEWVAKWKTFGITVEGAGMDHSTKGGSRDVAAVVLKTIFDQNPPINIPYGFFLMDGSKMSSSKGIGATARDMSNFLPTEILRFLMLRTPPKRAIDFSPSDKYITGLYSDFDNTKQDAFSNHDENGQLARNVFSISEPKSKDEYYFSLSFSVLKTLVQLPHVNIEEVSASQKGSALTPYELEKLNGRVRSVEFWIKHYATEDDIFSVQTSLPAAFYEKATSVQCAFLKKLHDDLISSEISSPESFQSRLFTTARLTPIPAKDAFKAIYLAFLNKDKGPVAGNLLYHLDKHFVLERLSEIAVNETSFIQDSASSKEDLLASLTKHSPDKISITAEAISVAITLIPNDGKVMLVRLLSSSPTSDSLLLKDELSNLFPFSIEAAK